MKPDNYRSLSLYILPFLYRNRASKIKESVLVNGLSSFIREPNSSKLYSMPLYEHLQTMLQSLEGLKLLILHKKKIEISKKFTLNLPLVASRAGYFFVDDQPSKISLFISAENSMGGMHNDLVEVLPIKFSKRGLEGKVVSITKEYSTFLSAEIVGFQKTKDSYLISINQSNYTMLGFLSSRRKFHRGDIVFVQKSVKLPLRKTFLNVDILKKFPNFHSISYLKCFSLYEDAYQKFNLSRFDKEEFYFLQTASRYNIPLEYSKEAVLEKEIFVDSYKKELKNRKRKDLSHLYSCTIDGETAKDFDDAISIEVNKDTYRLFVHIADVSFFVEKGSLLDKEAYKRGTSYYLGSFVSPMLPNILSEELCSLCSQVKRLTLTCEMLFSKDLEVIETKLYESIIFVKDRFTYKNAEQKMKAASSPLHPFYDFSKLLINKYSREGKLDLNIAEVSFKYHKTTGYEAINRDVLFSHQMIESFMLAANQNVAKFLKKKYNHAMYRVHEKMPAENIEKLNTFLQLAGINTRLQKGDTYEIRDILKKIELTDKKEMFPYVLLRCFSQAFYGENPLGHWGLNFVDYTHFTSPIRRYADLVVHRMIKNSVSSIKNPWFRKKDSAKDLKEVGLWISKQERVAMEAERSIKKLQSLDFLEKHLGKEFVVFFSGFHGHGLFVLLVEWMIDLFIPTTDFSKSATTCSKNNFQVVLPKYQKTIMIGDKLRIKIVEIDKTKVNAYASIVSV